MRAKLYKWFNRLESLSVREQVLIVAGLPLALALTAEGLAFGPARERAVAIDKQAAVKRTELTALQSLLAAQPTTDTLPAAEQLQNQRDEMRAQIESARSITQRVGRSVDWGMVVRGAATGTSGLTITSLRALPPEVAFDPAKVTPPAPAQKPGTPPPAKPASAPAGGGLKPAPGAGDVTVYRHRAELKIRGTFPGVVAFMQNLQGLPGELHWDKLQLDTTEYPTATVQMNLHIMSTRPDTPFN